MAGAGAGGLAVARALGGLGLRVLVLDRQQQPSTVAKGEILQPETARLLDSWGALEPLLATGARPVDRLAIRDPQGDALLSLDYRSLPGNYRQILCAEYAGLQQVLADGLAPSVRTAPRGAGDRAAARRRRPGGRGEHEFGRELRAPLVVAADGMSSGLRKAAGIEVDRREYPHRLLAFDVEAPTVAAEVTAYRTVRGLCLVYPLPGGRCRLYVQTSPDEFRGSGTADLSGWLDGVLADAPALRPLEPAIRASLQRKQLLAVYRLRADRLAAPGLALVGEAAHAVHPMAAQGVNSSLGDAEALGRTLAGVSELTPAAVDRALAGFETARRDRLDHLATVSHNASRMITSVSGLPSCSAAG